MLFLVYFMSINSSYALKQLPTKPLVPTVFCSDMNRIDQAERVNNFDLKIKSDRIVVSKNRQRLYLLKNESVIAEYAVSFGFGFTGGQKAQEGDGKTPEGLYFIDMKNSQSAYYKSLHISYPNKADRTFAQANGVNAGSDIMIHGFPNQLTDPVLTNMSLNYHLTNNWTFGCIAMTNSEIDEVYKVTDVNTKVEICPLSN